MKIVGKLAVSLAFIAMIALLSGCSLLPAGAVVDLPGGDDSDEPEVNNLLLNGDFSDVDQDGKPVDWIVSHGQGTLYPLTVEADGPNGLPTLKFIGSADNGRTIVTQKIIPAEPYQNKTLQFSGWYKGENVALRSGTQHFLRVEFWKAGIRDGKPGLVSAGSTEFIYGSEATSDWDHMIHTFQVPPEAEEIWVGVVLTNASGTVWWADVRLNEITEE